MYARLLNSIVPNTVAITLFPPHTDQYRFRGTEIILDNGDTAVVHHTNGNETTIVVGRGGKKTTRILSENATISRLVDNSLIQTRRQSDSTRSRSPKSITSLELRKKNVEHKISENRIYFAMGHYYIEFDRDTADLCSGKNGHIKTYPNSEKGLVALATRVRKIDDLFDPSKLPIHKMGER